MSPAQQPSIGPGPSVDALFIASWQRLWSGLGARGDGHAARDDLLVRHAEPWRAYHTQQHLGECLVALASAAHLAERAAEVEAGLWFHDAVYEPRRDDNEARSALLAQQVLGAAQVAPAVADRVAALVLATRHLAAEAAPPTADAQLLLDIDLGILGAPAERFADYERQIRQEYAFVARARFDARRRAVLCSFLARPRLYGTDFFHDRLAGRARANLTAAVGADAVPWAARRLAPGDATPKG